ncbi:hypothetical protein SAMD00019534_118040, partial [Acytostelium subglobosum LB1]|uniref:hypothetical protein n=1 Tax=Acytostelium subglobosum LB1 TaxID=1410327 RepID=UPI000644A194
LILLLVVVVVVTNSQSLRDNNPDYCIRESVRESCTVTNPAPFDKVDDIDIIDVYHLEAPIFESVYGDFFGRLHGFHSAIGFFDRTTGNNYTAEYDAFYEVGNGTFPNIIEVNGTKEIIWCNAGNVCSYPFINTSYWSPEVFHTASMTLMTRINGSVFNKFNQWMISYNTTNAIYQTWDVWTAFGKNHFVGSNTCDDFVVQGLQFLATQGAVYNCSTLFKRDYLNVYSDKPVPVDFELEKNDIMKYYEALYFFKGQSIIEIIEQLFSVVELKKYIYIQGSYYHLNLRFPYVDIRYELAPVPNCPFPYPYVRVGGDE